MALANISNPLGGGAGATTGIVAGGAIYGLNSQTITGNSSGAWAITANGTNQSITLTPSGTGTSDFTSATASTTSARFGRSNSGFESLVEVRNKKTLVSSGTEAGRGAIRLIDTVASRNMELGYYEFGGGMFLDGVFEFFTQRVSIRNFSGSDGGYLEVRDGADAESINLTHNGTNGILSTTSGSLLLTPTTSRILLGGTTSSFPSIKQNSATVEARLADDSTYAAFISLYIRVGSGSPENNVSAPVGAIYSRTDGGAGTTLYVKESGAGSTGWVAK